MNTSIIKTMILGIAAISIISCNKQLNRLPDQAKVEGNVILDAKTAQVALNGAYYRFANVRENNTTGLPATDWSRNHEQLPASMAGTIIYYQGPYLGADNTFMSDSYEALEPWKSNYLLVNAANGVISGLEALDASKIDAARKTEIAAEARFLRAYGHYALLNYFGEFYDVSSKYGVTLRKEPVTVNSIAVPRSSVQESYDFILADVDDAIANIKEGNPNYYASKWAAMALKMRILINRGAAGDYEEVITLADNIINNGPYELEPHSKDIFKSKGLSSSEIILATKAFPNQPSETEAYWWRGESQYYAGDVLVDYLQGDPRLDWMVTPVDGNNTFTKYDGPQFEAKYTFRLTEVYLLKAEAIVRSGGALPDAKTIVKEIMSHADVTDFSAVDNAATPDELLLEIYKEISRNLAAEDGIDWFALLRLPFETVQQIKPFIQSKTQYILPVPLTEYQKNPTVAEQNPGYGW